MFSEARRHMMYRIANATVLSYPFPHMVVTEILPPGFHRHALAMLPADDAYLGFGGAGRRTFIPEPGVQLMQSDPARAFWTDMLAAITHEDVGAWIMARFYDVISARFGLDAPGSSISLRAEATLARDDAMQARGPSTGGAPVVVTSAIQLAPDASRGDLGLSLYVPNDQGFSCGGGIEHPRARFERVTVIPYAPNTLVAMPKTDQSFVGHEAVDDPGARRDLLLHEMVLPG